MAMKSVLFISLLVCAMASSQVGAQVGIPTNLSLIRINGTVFCTVNGNIGVNGASTPVFANAQVQLQCGGRNVANATTNASGVFSIILGPLPLLVQGVLSGCNIVVNTPLASCNATLPTSGILSAPLQLVGTTIGRLFRIVDIIVRPFIFIRVT